MTTTTNYLTQRVLMTLFLLSSVLLCISSPGHVLAQSEGTHTESMMYVYRDAQGEEFISPMAMDGFALVEVLSSDVPEHKTLDTARLGRFNRDVAHAFLESTTLKPKETRILKFVIKAADTHDLPVEFVMGVITAESAFNPDAVSRVGAEGLMQLMPGTAKAYGVEDSFDPEQNIEGGCAYFARLAHMYRRDVRLMLAAYNAGPGTLKKRHYIPPRSTLPYIRKITRTMTRYRRRLGVTLSSSTSVSPRLPQGVTLESGDITTHEITP